MKFLSDVLIKAGLIVDRQVAIGTNSPFAGYNIDSRGSHNFGNTSTEVYHYFSSSSVSGGSTLSVYANNLSANSSRSHIMLADTAASVPTRFGLGVYTGTEKYAYLDSASKLVFNANSGQNVLVGGIVDNGYKFQVYGDTTASVYRGSNGAPLITFDGAVNRVRVDSQGYGTTLGHSLIVSDYLSVESRAAFNSLIKVKGNNSVVSYAIVRPDAPALDSNPLSGMGPRFNTLWYTGAGLSFYVSEGADISGGANIAEKFRISPNGDLTAFNLAGTGTRMVVADSSGVLSTQAIPTFTDTNIYNSDGTLTGNRTVTMGGNTLTFSNNSTSGSIVVRNTNSAGIQFVEFQSNTGNSSFGKLNSASSGFAAKNITLQSSFWYNGSNGDMAILNDAPTGKITLLTGAASGTQLTLFPTGNLLIQNAGTHTDAGFRLDVNGTARIQGNIGIGTTIPTPLSTTSAYQFIGLAGIISASSVATNDLNISMNTYWNGTNNVYRTNGAAAGLYFSIDGSMSLYTAPSGTAGGTTTSTVALQIFNNRNIGINTTTDAGFRLDVNGTARVTNFIQIDGGALNFQVAGTQTVNFNSSGNYFNWIENGGSQSNAYMRFAVTNVERLRILASGNVLIGTTTDVASSIFTLASTTKGFLMPRMDTTQRNAIASPATGLMVYDTTDNEFEYYNGTAWTPIRSTNIYNSDGTLTGNRTVTMGSNTLTFSGNTVTFNRGANNYIRMDANTDGSAPYIQAFFRGGIDARIRVNTGGNVGRLNMPGGFDVFNNPSGLAGFFAGSVGVTNGLLAVSSTGAFQTEIHINYSSTGAGVISFREAGVSNRAIIGYSSGLSALQIRVNEATNTSNGILSTAFFSTGNVAIGSLTDAGFRADINGTMRVQGLATLRTALIGQSTQGAGVVSLTVRASTGDGSTNVLSVTNEGGTTQFFGINGSTGISTFSNNVLGLSFITGNTTLSSQLLTLRLDTPSPADATLTVKGGNQNFQNRAGGNLFLQGGAAAGSGDGINGFISFGISEFSAASGVTNTISEVARFSIGRNLLIGTTTDVASSILTLASTTKGFLMPRMTTTQRNAITSPATGLIVYDTTDNEFDYYNGTAWVSIRDTSIYTHNGTLTANRTITDGGFTTTFTGSVFLATSTGSVGVGTTTPGAKLHVDFTPASWDNNGAISSFAALRHTMPASSSINSGYAVTANYSYLDFTIAGSSTISQGALAAGFLGVNRVSFSSAGSTLTMTQSGGNARAYSAMQVFMQTGGSNSGTITHGASLFVQGIYPASNAVVTFTNYYGLLINPLDEWGTVSLTNRWGIFQAGSSDRNYLAGDLGIGTSTPSYKLHVIGSASISGDVFMGLSTSRVQIGSSGDTSYKLSVDGDARIYGKIRTETPTGGVGPGTWKLGSTATGTFTLDTALCVEVEINGTLRKLALVN